MGSGFPAPLAPHPSYPPSPYRQVGAQRPVLLVREEAAALLQRHVQLPGEPLEEAPQQAGLEVRQHAVHVHQHPHGPRAPRRRPHRQRREAGDPGETRNRPRERAEPGAGMTASGAAASGAGARGSRCGLWRRHPAEPSWWREVPLALQLPLL